MFIFNKHNVCTNPKIIEIYDGEKCHSGTQIRLAESEGKWGYGLSVSTNLFYKERFANSNQEKS